MIDFCDEIIQFEGRKYINDKEEKHQREEEGLLELIENSKSHAKNEDNKAKGNNQ